MPCRFSALIPYILSLLLAGPICASFAAGEQDEAPPGPLTTHDLTIPSDELDLLLAPLTQKELLVEADAWQEVVRAKAWEIANALVAVKRQNREIEKAQEAETQARAAREELEQVEAELEEAKATGDHEHVAEAGTAAAEAERKMAAVSDSVDEFAAAAEKTAEVESDLPPEGRETLEEAAAATDKAQAAIADVRDLVDEGAGKGTHEVRAIAAAAEEATEEASDAAATAHEKVGEVLADTEEVADKTRVMAKAGKAMAQAQEVKREAKVDLLEEVTLLREERVLLLDNLRTVVDELEAKTDKEDGDTMAAILAYRLYMRSVSGITIDVTDTTSVWVALRGWFTSSEGGIRWGSNIAKFIGILALTWLLARLLSRSLRRIGTRLAWPTLLNHFASRIARILVWIAGSVWALSTLEVSIAPLLALVGAAGFIIAFAMQDTLSNFASGLMILVFQPFDVGDVVDAGGVSGKVESMNLVSTSIKTFDNKLMIIPNNKIWGDVITNASTVDERRVDMEFGIGYDADIERAHEVLEAIVSDHPLVLKDPEPTIRLSTLADSSVNFICRPWAKTSDYWAVYWDVTKTVKLRFDEEGIGIPFPQRDVHLYVKGEQLPAAQSPGPAGHTTSPAPDPAPTSDLPG